MKLILRILIVLLIPLLIFSCKKEIKRPEYVLVIHGGAGGGKKESITEEQRQKYNEVLTKVLAAGEDILKNGGSSLDAVEAVINIMEDSPLFNSGKGAVFTSQGKNELDASIMDGSDLNAGAVASVTTIKNPISAARKVMTDSKHVLLVGKGAEIFAKEQGLEMVDTSYFFTPGRWETLQKIKEREKNSKKDKYDKFSTVGAVALDMNGNLAAGTSTGGMTNKMFGRIGDSPIIGAGTYADNASCAVSATGHGEYFIRNVVAYDIGALMKYRGWSLAKASEYVVMDKLVNIGAGGGIIAVDYKGNVAMDFNTTSMMRGVVSEGGGMKIYLLEE